MQGCRQINKQEYDMLDEQIHLFPCDSVNVHRKYSLSFLFSGLEPALELFVFLFLLSGLVS